MDKDHKIGKEMLNARRNFKEFRQYNEYYSPCTKSNLTLPRSRKRRPTYKYDREIQKLRKKKKILLNDFVGLTLKIATGVLLFAAATKTMNKDKHGFNEPEDYSEYGGINGRFNDNSYEGRVKNKIIDEAIKQGVDPNLALGIAETESHFNQNAKSQAGAIGIFQLMPNTAKGLGINPYDEDDNIKGGIKYIKQLLNAFNGDEQKALAAYNWGIGNVNRKGLQQAPKETREYVPKVLKAKQKFKQARESIDQNNQVKQAQKGGKVGGYTLGMDVKISEPMKKYLQSTSGTGYITSGIRGNSNSNKSHTSGNKIDVAINNNKHYIIKTVVPFMLNPATVHVSFECLGPRPQPANSLEAKRKATVNSTRIANEIVSEIKSKYPDIAQRINNGSLQAITNWGWMYGSGPHLDILIDPSRVSNNNSYTEGQSNNIKKAKDNSLVRQSKMVQPPHEESKQIKNSNNIKFPTKCNIQTGQLGKISPIQTYKNTQKTFN